MENPEVLALETPPEIQYQKPKKEASSDGPYGKGGAGGLAGGFGGKGGAGTVKAINSCGSMQMLKQDLCRSGMLPGMLPGGKRQDFEAPCLWVAGLPSDCTDN